MTDSLPVKDDVCTKLLAVTPLSLMLLLGILFAVFPKAEISEVENRRLADWPQFSAKQFWSGDFASGIDLYVADRFLARESLMNLNFGLQRHLGLTLDRPQFYAAPDDEHGGLDRADQWGVPDEDDEDAGTEAPEAVADAGTQEPQNTYEDETDEPANTQTATDDPDDEDAPEPVQKGKKPKAHTENGILIVDNRAFQIFGGQERFGERYAEIINAYKPYLLSKTRIFSIIAPTSVSFYLPSNVGKRSRSERDFIAALYKAHTADVISVDLFPLLDAHKDEFLYFRTDHHWTARAAYYAYVAYCQAAGLEAVPLSKMTRKVKENFVGSLYGYTKAQELKDNPEYVEYFLPPGDDEAKAYDMDGSDKYIKSHLIRERSGGYNVFLGGDHPFIDAVTTVKNGKSVLVVKNSYGNPFVPFLRAHYEHVFVIDYRYYKGSLPKLVAERGIDDVVFMNVTTSAGSTFHRGRLKKLMGSKKVALKARAAAGDLVEGEGEGDGGIVEDVVDGGE